MMSGFEARSETRVIYAVSGLSEWTDTAARLQTELAWRPVYWLTQLARNHSEVLRRFPGVVAHLSQDANRGIPAAEYADCFTYPLDEELLSALQAHERVALQMMDRMDLEGSFTFIERRRAYHRLLMYWMSVVERLQPDVIVFNTPPHSIAEYVLYAVARQRGLHTAIFVSTALNGLLYVNDSVEADSAELAAAYADMQGRRPAPAMSAENRAYMEELRAADASAVPWYVPLVQGQAERQHRRYLRRQARAQQPAPAARRPPARHWWSGWFAGDASRGEDDVAAGAPPQRAPRTVKAFRRVYKQGDVSWEASQVDRASYNEYLQRVYPRKLRLKAVYESLCVEPPTDVPFVFVPLHYQPERTTCPDGGVYNDQTLMIVLLARALPPGWWLYVKEHPTQFSYSGTGEQARTEAFYSDLAAIDRVRLVALHMHALKLIDHAVAVATVTGMAGWEALSRGRPALVFGNAWYRLCHGAHRVTTYQDCLNAMQEIAAGITPKRAEVDAFVAAVESVAAKGFVNSSNAPAVKNTYEEHVASLTSLLLRYAARTRASAQSGDPIARAGGMTPCTDIKA